MRNQTRHDKRVELQDQVLSVHETVLKLKNERYRAIEELAEPEKG